MPEPIINGELNIRLIYCLGIQTTIRNCVQNVGSINTTVSSIKAGLIGMGINHGARNAERNMRRIKLS